MSGHNKWSQIQRQKGAEDAKRSKLFSMLARAITLESRKCGGNPDSATLRAAIEKARKQNMPNDNIERAIKRGTGADAQNFEEFLCEAYGPGGGAIIIEGLTDNKNRTLNEIKHILAEHGSALASQGSALWAFSKTAEGWVPNSTIALSPADEAEFLKLLEAIDDHEDVKNVYTNAEV
jgi:YebC/PmpR family DNA-binding regulatory protein